MKRSPLIFSTNEDLWSVILSQDEEKVKGTVKILDQETVEYIISHLKKMVTEEGWHPAQQASAAFALQVIKTQIQD
jgi:hypothetical protein